MKLRREEMSEDIIRIILEHLKNEYSAIEPCLIFGVNMEIEPKIQFGIPNYNIVCQFCSKEIVAVHKRMGTKRVLEMIDHSIEQMLIDYKRRFG